MNNNKIKLTRGILSINYNVGKYAIDDLFEIAERNNPKRAFLFVSKILGKHIPVSPAKMRQSYQELGQMLEPDYQNNAVFIGMAETAVGLAAGVFHEAKHKFKHAVLLTSTRHEMNAELLCEFKENHSHATDHLIYLPHDAKMREIMHTANTLVLIDDEMTTGNTFRNLITALLATEHFKHIKQIITLTLINWNQDNIEHHAIPVQSFALLNGRWSWQPDFNVTPPIMPNVNITKQNFHSITNKQDWGRIGTLNSVDDLGNNIVAQADKKILVIGSCEFLWKPFLLAERLEKQGAEVLFCSTTRSPIAIGLAIKSALSFADNYGQGIPNFIYNIAHRYFDQILLCVETIKESIDPQFLSDLRTISPHVEIICYE